VYYLCFNKEKGLFFSNLSDMSSLFGSMSDTDLKLLFINFYYIRRNFTWYSMQTE
jgi:hypothetical protein